ncbi:MAG: phytanoyl-CoA dioxygenase family protein [Pseudomonadales bacterium]|nr:phytanoyl-CoA dioxygenase family protein [Pseudomonadales bacterium]
MSVGTAMSPQPGVEPQGLHRDDGHYPLARPRPPFIANSLIALDDFTQANGATHIAPGSHKRTGDIWPNTDVIFAEMPAGSLLVFDGALWHAGGGNRTKDQRRRSINLNFNLSWLRQQENQYVGIPRTEWLKMPERLQRLLGFQKVNFLYGSADYTDPLVYLKQNAALLK